MDRFCLSSLCAAERKKPKVLGRGIGSTKGKTCGRGHKGAGARAGKAAKPYFEGGQTPLYRRLPKRGFFNYSSSKNKTFVISLATLEKLISSGTLDKNEISLSALVASGIASERYKLLKVIGSDDFGISDVKIVANYVTNSVNSKVVSLGGKVEVL